MTSVSTSAPTITNRPMKNTRVSHSTASIACSVVALEMSTSSPAPSRATTDGSKSSDGVEDEADQHRGEDQQRLPQQHRVA